MERKETAIETFQLTKRYGALAANNEVSLLINKGTIHAVIGENGAGKSTLMNMLYGMTSPDSGEIYVLSQRVHFNSPKDAIKMGIGMVHQHFHLVHSLTVFENIFLGSEICRFGIVYRDQEKKEIERLIKEFHFDLSADEKVENLSVGQQQRVEILKVLFKKSQIIILDEPTAMLTPQEADELLENLKQLKAVGRTIIIITHKLDEVKKCADEFTVFRQGKIVGEGAVANFSEKEMAFMMVGKEVRSPSAHGNVKPGKEVLSAHGITLKDSRGRVVLRDISFSVREGEILGIAGVEGNGQAELSKILSGLIVGYQGRIEYQGKVISRYTPERLRKECRIGIIPSDRYLYGLSKQMSIGENLFINRIPEITFKFTLNTKQLRARAQNLIREFSIAAAGEEYPLGSLSGGNAQKVILARELSICPDLILAEQPTWGVDIGAIEFIHTQILRLREEKKAVVLVSSELSEIYNLSDRILVFYKGEIVASGTPKNLDRNTIGLYMTGIKREVSGV